MSAICGVFYNHIHADFAQAQAMMNELGCRRFDMSRTWQDEKMFLGCHLNHIVPESVNEILPYCDPESSLVITADAILDNRLELAASLNLSAERLNRPDSTFILEAYKKWGINCPEKLVGDFAFAIWDQTKHELFCARDHVGKRTLYYYCSPALLAFSTLITPLFMIKSIKKQINDEYAADFLALPSVQGEIGATITIYRDIFQLPPAHAMLASSEGKKVWQYWRIGKNHPVRFKTDEEYEAAFRDIFKEAVKCRLRSTKKVGVMLSGGLDSSSVASIAAAELKKRNEVLYAYTQVPMRGYKEWLPPNKIADEREYVDELCEFCGNIEPHYVASEGKSPLTEIDHTIKVLEQPYKVFENLYWINEIMRRAAANGAGVLLDGQSGNGTISWGSWDAYSKYLFKSLQFRDYWHELQMRTANRKIRARYIFFSTLYSFVPYRVKAYRYKMKGREDYIQTLSPINMDFYKSMQVEKRFGLHRIDTMLIDKGDSFQQRMRFLNSSAFSHLGAIETKTGLDLGLIRRDPTRDKRLIEFCLNIPEDQWVRNGQERRLIRRAMQGYLPDMIRLNTKVRGQQAADWMQRICMDWKQITAEIAAIGDLEPEKKYLDIGRIKQKLANNQEIDINQGNNPDIRFLLRALIFSRFLRTDLENI